MRCPICETDNPDDLPECASCGNQLAGVAIDVAALDDLEPTQHAPIDIAVQPAEGIEHTAVSDAGLRVAVESIEIERTAFPLDAGAPSNWTAEVELESGREPDVDLPTPDPGESPGCPWCGAEGAAAVCDSCGRQRSRFLKAQEIAWEPRLCPACFSKVPGGARCTSCGVPFAPQEF